VEVIEGHQCRPTRSFRFVPLLGTPSFDTGSSHAFLRTHRTEHGLRLPSRCSRHGTAQHPSGSLRSMLLACTLHVRAVLSSIEPRPVPPRSLVRPFLVLSAIPSTSSVAAVFEGLQWRRPDRLCQTYGLVPVSQFTSDLCRPCRSWARLRLNPRARRSAPFCFLGSPVLASKRIRHAGPPNNALRLPWDRGRLLSRAPRHLGQQIQSEENKRCT
jgi:hypothetical protein